MLPSSLRREQRAGTLDAVTGLASLDGADPSTALRASCVRPYIFSAPGLAAESIAVPLYLGWRNSPLGLRAILRKL